MVRQYNQLIALMDNWDFFQENLRTVEGAEGTLQQQANVYAESWEAARDRVRAAAEGVYDSLINPDFYIGMDNTVGKFLEILEDVIDTLGGFEGVANVVFFSLTRLFGDKIAQGLRNTFDNTKLLLGLEKEKDQNIKNSSVLESQALASDKESESVRIDYIKRRLLLENEINNNRSKMSEATYNQIQNELTLYETMEEQYELSIKEKENLQETLKLEEQKYSLKARNYSKTSSEFFIGEENTSVNEVLNKSFEDYQQNAKNFSKKDAEKALMKSLNKQDSNNVLSSLEKQNLINGFIAKKKDEIIKKISKESQLLGSVRKIYSEIEEDIKEINLLEERSENNSKEKEELLKKVKSAINNISDENIKQQLAGIESYDDLLELFSLESIEEIENSLGNIFTEGITLGEDFTNSLQEVSSSAEKVGDASVTSAIGTSNLANQEERLARIGRESANAQNDLSSKLIQTANKISAVTMAYNSLLNSISNLVEGEANLTDFATTFVSVLPALSELPPNLLNIGKSIKWIGSAISFVGKATSAALPYLKAAYYAYLALSFVFNINKKIQEEELKKKEELNKKRKEEISTQKDLIKAYQDAYETYKKTGSGKKELEESALAVSKALNIENGSVLALTGNYKELNEEIKWREKKLREEEITELNKSKGYAQTRFANDFAKGSTTAYDEDENKITISPISKNAYKNYGTSNNWDVVRFKNDPFLKKYMDDDSVTLNVPTEEVPKVLDYLDEWVAKIEEEAEKTEKSTSELTENLKELSGKSVDLKETFEESIDELIHATKENFILNNQDNIKNIQTKEGYDSFVKNSKEELKEQGLSENQIENLLDEILLSNSSTKTFRLQDKVETEIKSRYPNGGKTGIDLVLNIINGKNVDDDILELISGKSAEELTILLDLIPTTSFNSLDDALNNRKIEIEFTVAKNSYEDIKQIQKDLFENNELTDSGKSIIENSEYIRAVIEATYGSLDNFYKNSVLDQSTFIAKISQDISNFTYAQGNKLIDELTNSLNSAEDKLEKWKENHSTAWNQVTDEEKEQLDYLYEQTQNPFFTEEQLKTAYDEYAKYIEKVENRIKEKLGGDKNISLGIEVKFDKKDISGINALETEVSNLKNSIYDLTKEQYELKFSWEEEDQLLSTYKQIKNTINELGTATNGYYEITIEQYRKLAEENADLANLFEATSNGKMIAKATEVQAIIQGDKDELNSAIQTEIDKNELTLAELEAKRDALIIARDDLKASNKTDLSEIENTNNQKTILGYALNQTLLSSDIELNDAIQELYKGELSAYTTLVEAKVKAAQLGSDAIKAIEEGNFEGITDFLGKTTSLVATSGEKIKAAVDRAAKANSVERINKTDSDTLGGTLEDKLSALGYAPDKGGAIDFLTDQIKATNLEITTIQTRIKMLQGMMRDTSLGLSKEQKAAAQEAIKQLQLLEDRYHKINRAIEEQKRLIEDLSKTSDRAYGNQKIALMDQEIAERKTLGNLLKEKRDEASSNLDKDRNKLKELIPVAQLNKSGNIENYEDVKAWVNEPLDKYNNMTAEEQKKHEKDIQQAEEIHKKRLEAISQYEETLDLYKELNKEWEDNQREIFDNELEKIDYKFQIKLDLHESQDQIDEFNRTWMESFGDNITHGLDVLKSKVNSTDLDFNLFESYDQQFKELVAKLGEDFGSNMDVVEKMDALQDSIIGTGEELLQFVDYMEEALPNALSDAKARFDEFITGLDHNIGVLDSIKEIMSLQGVITRTSKGFSDFQKISDAKMDASLTKAKLNKQMFEGIAANLAKAEAELAAVNEKDASYVMLKNNYDVLQEQYREAQNAMLESAQETMNTAKELFKAAIENAAYEFEQAVTNNKGFDLLQAQYDNLIKEDERYLDAVNQIYETQKLSNLIQSSIDEATDKTSTLKLKALQDEVNALENRNDVSQYELDILNKKYEMTLAQMALEDAQNAKNQLRLTRDNQGNWNYVYTANQDDIDNAQQDYADKANEYYNLAKDYAVKTSGEIIAAQQELIDKLEEIYNDDLLSQEQKLARAEEVQRFYTEQVKYLEAEKQKAIKDTGEAGSLVIDDFNNKYALNLDNMTNVTDEFETFVNNALGNMEDASKDYQQTVKDVCDDLGLSYDELHDIIDITKDSTDMLREAGEKSTEQTLKEIEAIRASTEALKEKVAVAKEYARLAGVKAQDIQDTKVETANKEYDENYKQLYNEARVRGYNGSVLQQIKDARKEKIKNLNITTEDPDDNIIEGYKRVLSEEEFMERMRKWGFLPEGFATGGYTGDFNGGKLAILHEKELILNKQDTENILTAVTAIRAIEPMLLQAISEKLNSEAIASRVLLSNALKSKINFASSDSIVQQVVSIQADFPGVSSAAEIEMALESLVTDAAQYAAQRKL